MEVNEQAELVGGVCGEDGAAHEEVGASVANGADAVGGSGKW